MALQRIMVLAGAGAAALSLAAAPAIASVKSLPTPVCSISGATFDAATGQLVAKGDCSYKAVSNTAGGRAAVTGVAPPDELWSVGPATATTKAGEVCTSVESAAGDTFVVPQPGMDKVSAVFTLRAPKNAHQQASNVATKRVSVALGGKATNCGTSPAVVAPEGPDSPTGSGNGGYRGAGETISGLVCGWYGLPVVDSTGIRTPAIDCSGNGTCRWVPTPGGMYYQYGVAFRPGSVKCPKQIAAVPFIHLDVTRPDGKKCPGGLEGDGVASIALKHGWGGSFTGFVRIETNVPRYLGETKWASVILQLPLTKGTANGPALC